MMGAGVAQLGRQRCGQPAVRLSQGVVGQARQQVVQGVVAQAHRRPQGGQNARGRHVHTVEVLRVRAHGLAVALPQRGAERA